MSKPILIIGPTFSDLLLRGFSDYPAAGEEVHVPGYNLSVGGVGITALVLSQLNVPCALLTTVGNDHLGRILLQTMENSGVETRLTVVSDELFTNLSVVLTSDVDRSFITAESDAQVFQERLSHRLQATNLDDFGHVHISFSLLRHREIRETLVAARGKGLGISADVGFADIESWTDLDNRILKVLDYFLPNHHEAMRLTGTADVEAAARSIHTSGAVPLITMGGDGLAVYDRDGGFRRYAPPEVEVVNTTGAGDSFSAGFIYGLHKGFGFTESLFTGMACGSATAASEDSHSPDIDETSISRLVAQSAGLNHYSPENAV